MTRVLTQVVLAAAVVCVTALPSQAQLSSSSAQTKAFEVIAVEGNTLVVKLPEGTREITVANDFRFTVNGQPLSVQQLTPGMKGTAIITTTTTVVPVTVTEVKNGTVVQRASGTIIVRTDEGVKMFSQGEVDKRGVKMMKDGRPATLMDFREGDRISATIITSMPPRIMTAQEVNAVTSAPASAARAPAPAAGSSSAAAGSSSASSSSAARTTPATGSSPNTGAPTTSAQNQTGTTLPKTASEWPTLALASVLLLAMGLLLTLTRRAVR